MYLSRAQKLTMATESWSVFSKSSRSEGIVLGKRTTTKTPGGVPEVGLTWDSFYECRSMHSFHKITLVIGQITLSVVSVILNGAMTSAPLELSQRKVLPAPCPHVHPDAFWHMIFTILSLRPGMFM